MASSDRVLWPTRSVDGGSQRLADPTPRNDGRTRQGSVRPALDHGSLQCLLIGTLYADEEGLAWADHVPRPSTT